MIAGPWGYHGFLNTWDIRTRLLEYFLLIGMSLRGLNAAQYILLLRVSFNLLENLNASQRSLSLYLFIYHKILKGDTIVYNT